MNRIADNLDDCSHSVRKISLHAKVIDPAATRLNQKAGELAGAVPLIIEGAERLVAAKTAVKTAATPPDPTQ